MLRELDAVQVRCESFNGQEVHNLATFAELVDGCSDKYMKFGLEGGKSGLVTILHEANMVRLPLIDLQILGMLLVPWANIKGLAQV